MSCALMESWYACGGCGRARRRRLGAKREREQTQASLGAGSSTSTPSRRLIPSRRRARRAACVGELRLRRRHSEEAIVSRTVVRTVDLSSCRTADKTLQQHNSRDRAAHTCSPPFAPSPSSPSPPLTMLPCTSKSTAPPSLLIFISARAYANCRPSTSEVTRPGALRLASRGPRGGHTRHRRGGSRTAPHGQRPQSPSRDALSVRTRSRCCEGDGPSS